MRLMYWGKDGGPESTCWGFWPIELKKLFSVAILKFVGASREAYHTHAFNSISWVLKGKLIEDKLWFNENIITEFKPSLKPILTHKYTFHKVSSEGTTWVLTFRGPWGTYWMEKVNGKIIDLTHGRKVITCEEAKIA